MPVMPTVTDLGGTSGLGNDMNRSGSCSSIYASYLIILLSGAPSSSYLLAFAEIMLDPILDAKVSYLQSNISEAQCQKSKPSLCVMNSRSSVCDSVSWADLWYWQGA